MSYPSYALWDAQNARAFYLATGSAIVPEDSPIGGDDGGTAQAHLELHQIAKATEVDYPWAPQFHYAIPHPSDHAKSIIGSALKISPDRVPLALFAGLVIENDEGTVDTVSGALEAGWAAVKQAWSNAVSQNYYAFASDAAHAVPELDPAQADQNYYRVTLDSRTFKWAVPGAANILAAVEAAHAASTSIADAIAPFANPSGTGFVAHLLRLHQENEARALQAVTAPEFAAFASDQGADATDLARAWLYDAGANPNALPVPVHLVARVPTSSLLDILTKTPAKRADSKFAFAPRTSVPTLQTKSAPLVPYQAVDTTSELPGGYLALPGIGGRAWIPGVALTGAGAVAGMLAFPSSRLAGAALGGAGGIFASMVASVIVRKVTQ